MSLIYQNAGHIILMLILLACSAFFSGTETAFFSLSRRQINIFHKSGHKLQNLVANLLSKPKQLLSSILFGSMIAEVLFYAVSSIFVIKSQREFGATAAAIIAVGTFAMLILFGEILPKAIALANSKTLSVAAALPVFACVKVFNPIVTTFRVLIVDPSLRLLIGGLKPVKPISPGEFKTLIDSSRKSGLITADENKLLGEIVELGFLKVRHVMKPRVDILACSIIEPSTTAAELMQKNQLTKLPVYSGTIDNIVGIVQFREILLNPELPLDKLVQDAYFVPEQKTVESLIEFFRKRGTDMAVVVDEYGGIAGTVRLEDIAEELFGPIEKAEGAEPIKQLGPLAYRLSGDIDLRDWADAFGLKPEEMRISTIGGFVTALLGRIPKSGDEAYMKNIKFTVEQVRKNRIETVIMTFESIRK